ncbi:MULTISPECIES: GntR family transcriptional regulator [Rhizobium]|uniref:GntR family transcriptional regulator n=1 Tax=Rhizobium TaxID=379 RepID=UPI001C83AD6E|nr:GntR family transcriptional regulator [Rhizobium sp. NLR10a]MBX4870267.1 GntR family transcriptional regulator [Rhizobium bangladeshense]MBX5213736.1 GntR family transcriptional regulator [Rhizobium sp. NLR9a]MBX5219113.1 GntR family transcriptional regulator [Rhizobium sp. NLR8a]MBX5232953.1 GntR family transcriptional regulator [Rhizobium sp. NLR4a]MBX5246100.1 GntR family transcriptional regulator [Rhizobium sp. NLR3b]MBX5275125.1 GntR family transcriptional regulator [Rhizobium sp. NLR
MLCCKNASQVRGIDANFTDEAQPAKADIAYDAILRLIGSYTVPEQPLRDQVFMSALGIGRTPVREAFQRLAAEGYIQSKPQRGFFTRAFSEGTLLNLYEVGRANLIAGLYRMPPQLQERWTATDKVAPDELALEAERIFAKIAEEASNCEACKIVRKFSIRTHPLRMEITASELRPAFMESLARLLGAMSHAGTATSLAEAALLDHLNLEKVAIPKMVQKVNARQPTGFSSQ